MVSSSVVRLAGFGWQAEVLPAYGMNLIRLARSGSELLPAFRESVLSGLRKTVAGLSGGDGEKYRHYKAILEELTDDDCS